MGFVHAELPQEVVEKLASLPANPGCYLFSDADGETLYVGKAKSLRSRVRSYFQAGGTDDRAFIPMLRRLVAGLETLVTATEKEAAILENSLIKERKPRFNVKLRDDKEYLNIRLDTARAWPRLELVRKQKSDGARYFGPYHSATAARRTLHLVEKHFQLRTCTDHQLKTRKRPCLQYQIKRCPGPCVFDVDEDVYAKNVSAVALFMDGRHDQLTEALTERMQRASSELEFELAATYRNQLAAVESIRQQQRVVAVTDRDQDVVGLYREGDLVEVAVLYVRRGRVIEASTFSHVRSEAPNEEVVAAFLREHYSGAALIPDEVILPVLPDGADGVADWLTERRRERSARARKCQLLAPSRGARRRLLELASENATHGFAEKRRKTEDVEGRLVKLQRRLRLPSVPRRIECCDISHMAGSDTVGAVVALRDGVTDKRRYRTYTVRSVADGDDYGAMSEVLSRRFARGRAAESGDDWELPDLFVVDGGRGQLAVARTAAADLGLHELRIVGLAKERETARGDKVVDRVYLPGQKNPISLRPNSPELYLLGLARDEAHRFANRARKARGKKRQMTSELETIPGIGKKTRSALLKALGSLAGVKVASDDAILAVPGVSRRQLTAIRDHFRD